MSRLIFGILFICIVAGCASSGSATDSLTTDPPETAASTVVATPDPSTLRSAVLLGALVERRPDQTPRDALEVVDAAAGRRLDLVRVDVGWNSEFPTRDVVEMIESGRSVYLTITPRRTDGSLVPWSEIANRHETVVEQLDRWAEVLASTEGITSITFHPGADLAPEFGTPEEFRAAWITFFESVASAEQSNDTAVVPDAERLSRHRVWVASDSLLRAGEPESWYPGDENVESIGTEIYNNFDCGADPVAWLSPRQMLSPLVAFGSQHVDKFLVAAAFGSVEDPANEGRKGDWYESIAETLAAPELDRLDTVVVHHGVDPLAPRCEWWVDSSVPAARGFGALATDPIVDGDHAAPGDVRCAKVAQYQSLASDGAPTDVDRDGVADLYFGAESPVVGVGEEGADGRDQRLVLPFAPLEAQPTGDERAILRVHLSGTSGRHATPVKLSVLVDPDSGSGSVRSFDSAAQPIDLAFMNPDSLAGYYQIDVTDYVSADRGVTFRLELEEPPALDGEGDPYFVSMSETELEADRPTLVVRSC